MKLMVGRIDIQPEKIQLKDGQIVSDHDFFTSGAKNGVLISLKRAIVKDCIITTTHGQIPFEMVVSLRGNYVNITINDDTPLYPIHIGQLLRIYLDQWFKGPQWQRMLLLEYIGSRHSEKYAKFASHDPYWFLATLHEIRDEQGPTITFSVEETKKIATTLAKFQFPVPEDRHAPNLL